MCSRSSGIVYTAGYVWISRPGLGFVLEPGGVPPTTSGLSSACGSSVNVSRPSDEPVGVVDVDPELGVDVDDCRLGRLMLLEREGVLLAGA